MTTRADFESFERLKARPEFPKVAKLADCIAGQWVELRETGEVVQVSRVTVLGETWIRYPGHDDEGLTCCPHNEQSGVRCFNTSPPGGDS